MNTLHVLLPPLQTAVRGSDFLRWLARGDRHADAVDPRHAATRGLFHFPGASVPAAALRHHGHAKGAESGVWLAADPAWVRSEATGARLMTWPLVDLTPAEAGELVVALQPLFVDAGIRLQVDTAQAWCLGPFRDSIAARFADPAHALGADLLTCLPQGEDGRPWRRLFNETQIVLHAHPVNATRTAAGQRPANALWFWGAGRLPGNVDAAVEVVASADGVLQGLARIAGAQEGSPDPGWFDTHPGLGSVLLDLDGPGGVNIDAWLPRFRGALRERRFDEIDLWFADGTRIGVRHLHRLRFWQRG